ncbi:MAG TPA: murein biosynthesis integral membrane protein MurJ [Holophagaceae bacterium]|nr:murein biosynthesis integral membrane protein MurJ [Holophagaceae bacterium]
MAERPSVLRSAAVVGAFTFLSRITGMLQSRMLAAYLGTGPAAEAFFVAYRLPNLLRRFTAEGTMTAAFLPTLNEVAQRDGEDAGKTMAAHFLGSLATFLALLCLLGVAAMGLITGLLMLGRLAPGLPMGEQLATLVRILTGAQPAPADLALTTLAGRLMFPYLLLVSLTAGLSAVLNLKDRFGLTASVSTFYNLAFMGFGWLCFHLGPRDWGRNADSATVIFALAVLAGGLLQLLILVPSFLRFGYGLRPGLHLKDPGVRLALKRMVPGILGSGVHPINVLLSTFLASRLAVGSQTVLFNSNMMGEMVLGLFAVSVATVSLPAMSRLAEAGDLRGLNKALGSAWRATAFLAIPGALGMAVLAQPTLALIFQKGRFTAADVSWTAWTLAFQAVGIPFIGASRIGTQALYALKDYKGPAQAAVLSMAANLVLSWVLLQIWGTGGIALANGLASMIGLGWVLLRLRGRLELPLLFTLVGCGLFTFAALPMGLVAAWGGRALGLFGAYQGVTATALRLLPLILLSCAVYFGLLLGLGNREARGLWERLAARFGR